MKRKFRDGKLLFQELAKLDNVRILSEEESRAILAGIEFNGNTCIARPKNHNQQLPQEEAQ